uniref:RCC1-like domain-containing protein n=1 Tax=Strigamia maritima TaxID=126957 RepID=T1JE11_STRMM
MAAVALYSWGANGHGQLGLGHNRENEANRPTRIGLTVDPQELSQITGGGSHSIILTSKIQLINETMINLRYCMLHVTDDGNIFGCGNNSKQQLGFSDVNDILYFTQLNFNIKIRRVACGWEHTLAVTDNGELYAWGANNFNQLGINSNRKQVEIPVKVEIEFKVNAIAAGIRHSLATTENGRIFSWGDNRKGQLGRQDDSKLPREIHNPQQRFIKDVVCGAYHSAAVDDSGDVTLWGSNNYGQLGLHPLDKPVISTPMLLERGVFNGEGVSVLRSGWTHFIALMNEGSVYSWGRNDYGQLGRSSEKKFDFIPNKIDGLHSPFLVYSGSEHNIAILNKQEECTDVIITWGWNEHGICGNGSEENVMRPTRLKTDDGKFRVSNCGCGSGQNFIVIS